MQVKKAVVRNSAFALLGMAALVVATPRVLAQGMALPTRGEQLAVPAAQEFEWTAKNNNPAAFTKVQETPFRPVMGIEAYLAAKKAAASQPHGPRGNTTSGIKPDNAPPPPTTFKAIYEGLNEFSVNDFGFWLPPDTEAAVNKSQIVEVVNSAVGVFTKTGVLQRATALSTFMQQGVSQTDPRILYDWVWNRWIIVDINHDNAADGTHTLNIALSQTSSATGKWWIYHVVVASGGAFWDYPGLGQTQDGVIVTGNVFSSSGVTGKAIGVAKARLYNGLGWGVPIWSGLNPTTTPANVIGNPPDQSDINWMASPSINNSTMILYPFEDPADPNGQSIGVHNVALNILQNIPPSASQPGTGNTIDTLDTRIVAAGQQAGSRLVLTNTVTSGGVATPAVYDINTSTLSLSYGAYYYIANSSTDWNAHVALLPNGNVGAEWTSDDSATFPTIAIGGGGIGALFGASGSRVFFSGTHYDDFRWGDNSTCVVDPSAQTTCYACNEYVIGNNEWGSKFVKFTIP